MRDFAGPLRYAHGAQIETAVDHLATNRRVRAAIPDPAVRVRRVQAADIAPVIALDTRVTRIAKAEYWNDVFRRYGRRRLNERFFLVAEARDEANAPRVLGFIIGEIRAWEFGSTPCGWVFALSVDPDTRLQGVGSALFAAISAEFKQAGVGKMRTMVARDARLPMQFFRSEGMMAGPYLQLEKDIE
jgi:ribosomal protein S18 acetylase RimI-like enzyme